jgi:cell surface protein SprA
MKKAIALSLLAGSMAFAQSGLMGGVDGIHQHNASTLGQWNFSIGTGGDITLDSWSLTRGGLYTYKGKTYKVGELSSEVNSSQVLILKLLRGTSFSPKLPNWKLMMKNVYSLNAYQLSSEDFDLQIKYHNDKSGTELNYMEVGDINGTMLIKVFNLDNANSQLEKVPDGKFDFIEGVTVNSEKAKIYLPQLEPFGSYLAEKINDPADAARYSFPQLYDSTKTIAKQNADKDKFYLVGSYKSSSGSESALTL